VKFVRGAPMDTSQFTFGAYCQCVQQRIEQSYGVKVLTRDIPDPLTGDLDGLEIQIDQAVTQEQRLFLLAHLFGHTVQWNVDPGAFEIGRQYRPPVDERLFPTIIEYELEAARYGLALCHEAGISGIEQWFSNYTACDQKYLLHFYRTGEKGEFSKFWSDDAPLVQPKPIPGFTPLRRAFRMDGIVI
jgi:hypothetical protein